MGVERSSPQRELTRRTVVGRGLTIGIGLGAVTQERRPAARATPAATPATPVAARPELLIDANALIAADRERAVSIVALTPAEEFAEAHIPGAAHIDWPAFEVVDTSDASIARWRGEVEATLATLGISREATVVTYDQGTLFAARLWWILRYLGHAEADNRVLNGGLAAWQEAGGWVGAIPGGTPPAPANTTGAYEGEPQPAVLSQLAEVRASLDDPTVVFVDARTSEEYVAGHIPGAVNLNYPLNAQPEPPNTWKPVAELRSMYEALGVTPDKTVIPYCTSGVRSAVTFFTLKLIGYPSVALYTGSWQEWESVPGLPITTGDQP
ncbi:MAG: sulfurtransferase [Chloroflexota bacterium]|nr:sulfurtransferase [Chloroflexota bacterium]